MKAPKSARRIMKRMERVKASQDLLATRYSELRERLLKEFEECEADEFIVDDNEPELLQGKTWVSSSTTYDLNLLRRVLSKELLRRVVKVSVDNGKVSELFDLGLVTPKTLKPAARLSKTTNVSVRRVKRSQ